MHIGNQSSFKYDESSQRLQHKISKSVERKYSCFTLVERSTTLQSPSRKQSQKDCK